MQLAFQSLSRHYYRLSEPLINAAFLAQALARFYVAWVFFASGLTKLRDWETTLFLFEYEYAVPLLPFALAAWLATIAESCCPFFWWPDWAVVSRLRVCSSSIS